MDMALQDRRLVIVDDRASARIAAVLNRRFALNLYAIGEEDIPCAFVRTKSKPSEGWTMKFKALSECFTA